MLPGVADLEILMQTCFRIKDEKRDLAQSQHNPNRDSQPRPLSTKGFVSCPDQVAESKQLT